MRQHLDFAKTIYYDGNPVHILSIWSNDYDEWIVQIFHDSNTAYWPHNVRLEDLTNNPPSDQMTEVKESMRQMFDDALSKLDALKIR